GGAQQLAGPRGDPRVPRDEGICPGEGSRHRRRLRLDGRGARVTGALASDRYVVVERLVDERLARILYNSLLLRRWRGEFKRDGQVPDAQSHWGDSTLDAVLLGLQPDIEKACGRRLLPTYAYARLYVRGNALPRHRDRE